MLQLLNKNVAANAEPNKLKINTQPISFIFSIYFPPLSQWPLTLPYPRR